MRKKFGIIKECRVTLHDIYSADAKGLAPMINENTNGKSSSIQVGTIFAAVAYYKSLFYSSNFYHFLF